jgi:hypothetical protein
MRYKPGSHADDDVLEQYSLGSLPETDLEPFEEHLLVCPECQDRLAETDLYVASMKSAAATVAEPAPGVEPWFVRLLRWIAHPGPALALALGLFLSTLLVTRIWPHSSAPALAIALEANRSASAEIVPPGKLVALKLEAADLPQLPAYRVQVVKASGDTVFEAPSERKSGEIIVPGAREYSEGTYWVRVYDVSHTLLREYGLAVGSPVRR